jgi:Tubulin like
MNRRTESNLNNGSANAPRLGEDAVHAKREELRREISSRFEHQDHSIENLDESRFGSSTPVKTGRIIQQSLVITLGTSAAKVASMVKSNLANAQNKSSVLFRALDTDDRAKSGAAGRASFDNDEFVKLDMGRVHNILETPQAHALTIKQIGLDIRKRADFHLGLINKGIDHASQVRSFGYAAFLSNLANIRQQLGGAISELMAFDAGLKLQLASDEAVTVQNRLAIYVVTSSGGGTGSALVNPVGAVVRDLTKGMEVELIEIVISHNTFDADLAGKPEELNRLAANAGEWMEETNAAQTGHFYRKRIMIAPDDSRAFPIPPGLFNQVLVAGRIRADGRCFQSSQSVLESIALSLTALIGTEMGQDAHSENQNIMSMLAQSPDPLTGRQRDLGAIASQALVLPVQRIATNSATRTMIDILESRVIGDPLTDTSCDAQLKSWMAQPIAGEAIALDEDELPQYLVRSVVPNTKELIRPLFKVVQGNERLYHRNGAFADAVDRQMVQFRDTEIGELESRMSVEATKLAKQFRSSFGVAISKLVKTHGWAAAKQFCGKLALDAEDLPDRLKALSEAESQIAEKAIAKIKESVVPLKGTVQSVLQSKSRQDSIATMVHSYKVKALLASAKLISSRLFQAVIAEAELQSKNAASVLDIAENRLKSTKSARDDSAAGRAVNASTSIELDITTPDVEQEMFQSHRLDASQWIEAFQKQLGGSTANVLRRIATEPAVFDSAMAAMKQHFVKRFERVNIVQALSAQLKKPGTRHTTMALISQVMNGIQPMWTAESGQNSVSYADSMMIGIPLCDSALARNELMAVFKSCQTQSLRANSQYSGVANFVVSSDKHHIYGLRRTYGACWHWLNETKQAIAARNEWLRNGGHSLGIFNDEISSGLPTILPMTKVDVADLVFAIALAYGWIAVRGAQWYWNLERAGDPTMYRSKLSSHWNGIAFQDGKRTTGWPSIEAMIASGGMEYDSLATMSEKDRIGDSMESALLTVSENLEMIEMIEDAFDNLRSIARDAVVMEDLERYAAGLKTSGRKKDLSASDFERMVQHLDFQIDKLRSGR